VGRIDQLFENSTQPIQGGAPSNGAAAPARDFPSLQDLTRANHRDHLPPPRWRRWSRWSQWSQWSQWSRQNLRLSKAPVSAKNSWPTRPTWPTWPTRKNRGKATTPMPAKNYGQTRQRRPKWSRHTSCPAAHRTAKKEWGADFRELGRIDADRFSWSAL